MVEVYALRLDEYLNENKFNDLLTYVSSEKSKRIKRFHRLKDAQKTLLGDILIR